MCFDKEACWQDVLMGELDIDEYCEEFENNSDADESYQRMVDNNLME